MHNIKLILLLLFIPFVSNGMEKDFLFSYFESSDTSLTINSVEQSSLFQKTESNMIFSKGELNKVWIKIKPQKAFSNNDYIVLSNSINCFENVHLFNENGLSKSYSIGTDQVYESNSFLPSFKLNKNITHIIIEIRSNSFLFENIQILNLKETTKLNYQYIMLYFGSFLLLLFLGGYFFITYHKTKKRVIKKYLVFIISVAITTLFISNFGRYFFWKQLPFSYSYIEGLAIIFMVTAYLSFIAEATYLKLNSKILYFLIRFLIIVSPLAAILSLIMQSPIFASKIANIVPPLAIALLSVIIVRNLVLKNNNAPYILIGFSFFLISISIRMLMNYGVLPIHFTLESLVFIAMIFEIFTFSFVVIVHIEKRLINTVEDQIKLNNSLEKIELLNEQIRTLKTATKNTSVIQINDSINSALVNPLSRREIEVLNALAKGLTYKKIAEHLHISVNTLKTHVNRIYTKLETKNKVETINKISTLNSK